MRTARILAAVAAAALLAACGGGGGSSKPANVVPGQPTNQGAATPSSTSFKYTSNALTGTPSSGAVQIGTMKVDVQMNLPNVAALHQYAVSVGDPTSGLYRHFLTPEEIGSRFGASDADYNAAIAYFTAAGLQVTGWKQKSMLRVVGPQANIESAFGTTFALYHLPTGDAYGPATTPHFSKPLAVHSVTHLVYSPKWTKRNSIAIPPHGTTPAFNFGLPPQQIAAAFDYTGAYQAGFTGTGINIGIIGTGPISSADYAAMKTQFGLSWIDGLGASHNTANTITQVNVQPAAGINGGTPATPPPVTGPCNTALPACNPEDGEAQIDTQQTAALAPTANVLFYLAYVPHETFGTSHDFGPEEGISEVNDEVQQAINDNMADILSLSYGIAEQYSDYTLADGTTFDPNGTEPVQFAMLQAEGIAVFVSSGDAGAQGCSRPFDGVAPGVAGPNQPSTRPGRRSVPTRRGASRPSTASVRQAAGSLSPSPSRPTRRDRGSPGPSATSPTLRSTPIPLPASRLRSTSGSPAAVSAVSGAPALPHRRWLRCGRSYSTRAGRPLPAPPRGPARSRTAWATPHPRCTRSTTARRSTRRRSSISSTATTACARAA